MVSVEHLKIKLELDKRTGIYEVAKHTFRGYRTNMPCPVCGEPISAANCKPYDTKRKD